MFLVRFYYIYCSKFFSLTEPYYDRSILKFATHERKINSWICEIPETFLSHRGSDIAKPVLPMAIIMDYA